MATWVKAGKARTEFADLVASLTPEQLKAKTLCSEWDARGVASHMASFVETSLPGFFMAMVKAGFNSEKGLGAMAAKQMSRPLDDVLESLRTKSTKSAALPVFPEMLSVADAVIHTQDIRRPLGLPGVIDESTVRDVLDFLTTHKMATTLVERRDLDGIRFAATDMDWSFGTGDEITGAGEALMMALANRDVTSELSGAGLAKWS